VKPIEHYREAERLLAEAEQTPVIVTAPDTITQEQADTLEEALKARFGNLRDMMIMPESIKVDATGILLAAQVHATLALADE